MKTAPTRALSRSDAVAIWMFMLLGAIIAVSAVIAAVLRIIEVAPNHDVAVAAVFAGTVAEAPIGPGGASMPVELEQATVTVAALPWASWASLIIQQLVAATTTVVVVVCLLLLCWSVLRDRVFSRRNTALVVTAGITGTIGFAAVPFFGNMAANGAFARLSDGDFENVVMSVEPLPFLLLAFVAAMAAAVFTVGDRLQRDTEGLV